MNLRSVNSSEGRFLTGTEQGPVMNQGDGILVLIRSVVTKKIWRLSLDKVKGKLKNLRSEI